jgi:hypothetical protein
MAYYPPPPQPYPPPQYGPRYSGCLKFILYAVSFLIPIAGVIIAVIFMSKGDPESNSLGKTCLTISIASFVVGCCLGGIGGAVWFFVLEEGMMYY